MNKYLISIVVPFFNEQEVVDSFYKRLTESINKCEKNDSEIKFELIFVDNGSTDNTFDILSNLNDESRNIKIIKLIRILESMVDSKQDCLTLSQMQQF